MLRSSSTRAMVGIVNLCCYGQDMFRSELYQNSIRSRPLRHEPKLKIHFSARTLLQMSAKLTKARQGAASHATRVSGVRRSKIGRRQDRHSVLRPNGHETDASPPASPLYTHIRHIARFPRAPAAA